jgi:hypothetical protein
LLQEKERLLLKDILQRKVKCLLKWEYKVIDLIKEKKKEIASKSELSGYWLRTSDIEKVLNEQGEQGWELIDIQFILEKQETIVVGFFKRALITKQKG